LANTKAMFKLNELFPHDDVVTLRGNALNEVIARELGYRQGRDLSLPEQEQTWFAQPAGQTDYEPLPPDAMEFSSNTSLALSLPLPEPTDCYEDWIHTEMGPEGRWIVRLIRFYRAKASQPWKSRELYVADRDDDPVPIATAYGRAWLFSHSTCPTGQRTSAYDHTTLAGKPAA
jgi:hypothetical protein